MTMIMMIMIIIMTKIMIIIQQTYAVELQKTHLSVLFRSWGAGSV